MQFISDLACWSLDADGLKKELERIVAEFMPKFEDLRYEAIRAEVLCEYTSDTAFCDEMNKLQREVMRMENEIVDAKQAIAILEEKCG